MRHRQATTAGVTTRAWILGLTALLLPWLGACDTEELLQVDTPGRVVEEALDDPGLAETLVNSVISDVECSWDNYVAASAHHSDEYMQASGNGTFKRWGLRQVTSDFSNYASSGCGDWGYGLFTTLHTARFQAESNYDRIQGFEGLEGKAGMLASIRTYGAFPLIAFGEGFCETPLDGEDPALSREELLSLAEARLDEAVDLAGQAGRDDLLNAARVARARVRLNLGNFQGAIADAELVPEGFVFNATRGSDTERRYNTHYEWVNGPQWKHATIAPNYRNLEWKGVADERLVVTQYSDGELGFDFATPHWKHQKVSSRADPVLMASYREARMFIAEAAARSGDLERARTILNEFHAAAGVPPVEEDDVPTQADVIRHVIQERSREFFAEGGHRMRDHILFRGTEFEVPFLGEPGSIHGDGVDHVGIPYGNTTCFPRPEIERG